MLSNAALEGCVHASQGLGSSDWFKWRLMTRLVLPPFGVRERSVRTLGRAPQAACWLIIGTGGGIFWGSGLQPRDRDFALGQPDDDEIYVKCPEYDGLLNTNPRSAMQRKRVFANSCYTAVQFPPGLKSDAARGIEPSSAPDTSPRQRGPPLLEDSDTQRCRSA